MVEKDGIKFYFFVLFLPLLLILSTSDVSYAKRLEKRAAHKKVKTAKTAKVQKKLSKTEDAHLKRYTIKKGDTLEKIAKESGCSLKEITRLNPKLKSTRLKIGTVIVLPVKDSKVAEEKKTGDEKEFVYRVKRGETLYSIAKRYNLSVEEIKKLNKLRDEHLLAGMPLLISKLDGTKPALEKNNSYSLTEVDEDDVGDENEEEIEVASGESIEASSGGEGKRLYTLTKDKWEQALNYSLDFLGIDYKFGGDSISAIDCSAFVRRVFKRVGINLPRTSREQYTLGVDVSLDEIREGDLLFFSKRNRINHVGIYIGNNLFIHAARKGKGVIVTKLDSPYVKKHLVGAKRIFLLEDENAKDGKKDELSLAEKTLVN